MNDYQDITRRNKTFSTSSSIDGLEVIVFKFYKITFNKYTSIVF